MEIGIFVKNMAHDERSLPNFHYICCNQVGFI